MKRIVWYWLRFVRALHDNTCAYCACFRDRPEVIESNKSMAEAIERWAPR